MGTLTQSAFHRVQGIIFLTTNLSRTITTHGNGSIESPYEFVTNLFESDREVPCQFRSYYIGFILVFHLPVAQCIFRLKELKESM